MRGLTNTKVVKIVYNITPRPMGSGSTSLLR